MSSLDSHPVSGSAASGSGSTLRPDSGPAASSVPGLPVALPPTDVRSRGHLGSADHEVPYQLRMAAAHAWRLIVIAVAVYLLFVVLAKVTFVAVAVFVGLVITALLRPVVDLLARVLPRAMAVVTALLLTLATVGGVFTFITNSVAGQSASLTRQFTGGLANIERSLTGAPLHLRAVQLNQLGQRTDPGREGVADIRTARRPDSWPGRADNKQEGGQ